MEIYAKMKINKEWHKKNKMPANPKIEQRIKWHQEHYKYCACRPIPKKIAIIKLRGIDMKKYIWSIIFVIVGLYAAITLYYYVFTAEGKFRRIGFLIAKETVATVKPIGSKYAVSDAEREKTFARQRILFKEWQRQLKSIIDREPSGIWADDAQYLIAVLDVENPAKQVKELESLLDRYPDFHVENWTKKYLVIISERISPAFVRVRAKICLLYEQIGDMIKLKQCCQQGISDFPENKAFFDKISVTK